MDCPLLNHYLQIRNDWGCTCGLDSWRLQRLRLCLPFILGFDFITIILENHI